MTGRSILAVALTLCFVSGAGAKGKIVGAAAGDMTDTSLPTHSPRRKSS